MASGLEVIEYSALQDSFALQDASVRDLRELVDRKIFSRLRRTA